MIKKIRAAIQRIKCNWSNAPVSFYHGELRVVRKLSFRCELIECVDCGRRFAINHDVKTILPWEVARTFYLEDEDMVQEGQ